jgi:hypothetical protein
LKTCCATHAKAVIVGDSGGFYTVGVLITEHGVQKRELLDSQPIFIDCEVCDELTPLVPVAFLGNFLLPESEGHAFQLEREAFCFVLAELRNSPPE